MESLFDRLNQKVGSLSQHRFVRQVAVLQAGTLIGNVFQALAGVVLARLLQPELLGIYALAFSMASFTTIFLGTGAQDAVTSIVGEEYARRNSVAVRSALAFFVKVTLGAGLPVLAGTFLLPWIAGLLYANPIIGRYAQLLVVASLVSSTFFTLTQLELQVTRRAWGLMLIGIADQVVRYSTALVLVFLGFGIMGASVGHLVGAGIMFCVSFLVWRQIGRDEPIFPSLSVLLQSMRGVTIRLYLRFTFWVAVDKNLATLFSVLPVLMTGIFVSASEVTFFRLALGYVNLALSLLGPISTLLSVEFPRMKVESGQHLIKNFLRATGYALLLSSGLTIGAIITAPIMFKLLYGPAFLPSVPYVGGLFIYGALFGLGVGLGPMWRAINKVKLSIVINLITLGVGLPLGFLLINTWGLWGAVAMVTLWYTVSHAVSIVVLYRELGRLQSNSFSAKLDNT